VIDVTVVVPTYNRRRLLSQAVDSILRQRGVALELIVVDDGSSDGTGAWLEAIAAKDARVKAVRHARPRFVSRARNAGIAQARGRWVAFCDDDDLWAPDKLAGQLDALRAGPARWSCTGVVVVDERLKIVGHHLVQGGDILAGLLETNGIPTGSSVMAERSLLAETGGFDPGLQGSEDWDLWIRLAQRAPVAAINRPLMAYRLGAQTLSMDASRMRASRSIIAGRYAALARACDAQLQEAAHERYLAKQLLRAGARWQAASIFAALALKHKRWKELPRAAAALVAPRLTDRVGQARAAAAVPASRRRPAPTRSGRWSWAHDLHAPARPCGIHRPARPLRRRGVAHHVRPVRQYRSSMGAVARRRVRGSPDPGIVRAAF
jgi:cellulose synthase/poly-beta-1,6-N-acetylglucosamine synthase-like glycosyltransferase